MVSSFRAQARKSQQRNRNSRSLELESCEPRRLLAADLAVNITDGGATVEPGADVKYVVSYKNHSSSEAAPETELVVFAPSGTTLNFEASTSGWACEGEVCRLEVGELAAGASGNAELVLNVSDELGAEARQVSVLARIASSARDYRIWNNWDWSTTPIQRVYHDLRFNITDRGASVSRGGTVTYFIDFGNVSDNAAADAVITIDLPEGTTFSAEGSSDGWACEGQQCTLSVGEVAAQGQGEATIAVTVGEDLSSEVERLRIHGEISAAGFEASLRNNRDASTTPVRSDKHDLKLSITDQGASVLAGGVVTYHVNYGNRGDATAAAPVVTVNLPPHTSMAAEGSSEGWSCAEGVCTLTLADVASGESGEAQLAVQVSDGLPADVRYLRVDANMVAASGVDENPRNNSDPSFTPIKRDYHDLKLKITDNNASVKPGGVVVYAVDWSNQGEHAAPGAAVTVQLPEHTAFVATGSSEGWSCEGQVCVLQAGDVEPGAAGAAQLAVSVAEDVPAELRQIRVIAHIAAASGADRSTRNNRDPSVTPIQREYHDLRMKITDNGARAGAGEGVAYKVTWENRGAHPALGSRISVTIPDFTTFDAEHSSEGWTCDGQTCVLDVGDVAPDAQGEATLAITLTAELPVNVNHVRVDAAMAAASGVDWNPRNNHDPSVTPLNRDYHDLAIDFTDRGAKVAAGGKVQYYASYTNKGEHSAVGSAIRVELPEFTTFDAENSSEGWECVDGVCTLNVGDLASGDAGEAVLGLSVAEDLPADQDRINIWASIWASAGADARTRNNRNISVTPIEETSEEVPEETGEPAAAALLRVI